MLFSIAISCLCHLSLDVYFWKRGALVEWCPSVWTTYKGFLAYGFYCMSQILL